MLQSTPALLRVAMLGASVVVHAGLVVAAGSHSSRADGAARAAISLELAAPDLVPLPPAPPAPEPAPVTRPLAQDAAHPTHTHPYPVAPDHDAHPHDPNLVHAPWMPDAHADEHVADPPAVVAAPEAAAPRFVMSVSHAAIAVSAAATSASGAGEAGASEVVGEDGVDARPVLVSGNAPPYPAAAAREGIELDVPLTIVIGVDGNVVEARSTKHVGYGLDEAALGAIRTYRFTPGKRHGALVRVRMPWTVQFRLR